MTSGRFPSAAALTGRLAVPRRRVPWSSPPSAAFRAPAGGLPVDGRRQQRSIALSHIPPLPIPHGMEYPLGTRMYLGVVHPRPEARGRPFPRFPRSRSRVNLRVLPPLTWRPQGQPSPLQTPHGCLRIQGNFPTSRGQVHCVGPTVPHSMAAGFPVPGVCCLVLAVLFSASRCICNPMMSLSSLPHPTPGPVPIPLPSSHVYTLAGRQQRHGAGPLDPHPSGDHFVRLARVAPIPPSCVRVVSFLLDALGTLLPGTAPGSIPLPAPITHRAACIQCVYPTLPLATLWRLPVDPCLASCAHCPLSLLPLPVSSVLCGFSRCIDVVLPRVFFAHPAGRPPPRSLCVSVPYPAVSCLFCVFFFTLLPACTYVTTALVIGLQVPSVFVSGPLAHAGRAPWRSPAMPGGRPSLASPSTPSSLLSPPPSPVACHSPVPLLLLSYTMCAPLILSAPGLYLARPHPSLRLRPVLCPVGQLGRPPQVFLWADSPVVCPRLPPLHQFPDGWAGRPLRLNAGHWHGVTLCAMWCT